MLSLTKSFALMLLASASGIQAQDDCSNWVCGEKQDCDPTGLLKGGTPFVVIAASAVSSNATSKCTATQYAYVTGVIISRVTSDDAPVSFTYDIQPSSNDSCSASDQCAFDNTLTCGKGSGKDANVTITCDKDCELAYNISWACADLTTSDTSAPSNSSGSTNTSSSTTPNDAWTQARASLLGLTVIAIAALFQV